MARLLLAATFVLTTLFTLCVTLIHAQPVNDAALRTFVLPSPDCATPCWQGLEPGVTDIYNIMSTLNNHVWVSSVTHENYSKFSNGFVRWQWSDERPNFVLDIGNLWYDESVIQDFSIRTDVRLGDMLLLLGQPDWTITRRMNSDVIHISTWYPARSLLVEAWAQCAGSRLNVWYAKSDLTWVNQLPTSEKSNPPGGSAVLGAVDLCR